MKGKSACVKLPHHIAPKVSRPHFQTHRRTGKEAQPLEASIVTLEVNERMMAFHDDDAVRILREP